MKIHKESRGTILVATLAFALIAFPAIKYLGNWSLLVLLPLLVIYGLVFWFFRVPKRSILEHTETVVAPVDGKVVMIKKVQEEEFLQSEVLQISIFMSPLNVHICRYPVTGTVIYQKYHPGKYLVAWHEKSSTLNERTSVAVETDGGHRVLFRQIAGYVARRIVFKAVEGDRARAGHEFGFIKFGSRMDIFLPADTEVLCKIGDKTKGGLDVIARMRT